MSLTDQMRVVILGAGPAGTSCAIRLLESGFKVTIIEARKFPRQMPGETLHPGIEPLLKQLQIFNAVEEKNFIRHNGISVVAEGKENFQFYNESADWRGFQLYRKDFDEILLKKALALGAEYFEETSPQKIVQENGTIKAIVTDRNVVYGNVFIDATGKSAWLARQLKIRYEKHSPKLIIYYGYVQTNESGLFEHPSMIWDKGGWTWISRVTKEKVVWNRVNLPNEVRPPINWVPEQIKNCFPIGSIKAADVTWRIARKLSNKNYFFVGDSAFVLDPSSSQGVTKAIMSGIMVAHLLKAETNGVSRKEIHDYYESWLNQWFNENTESLRKIYEKNGFNLATI